MGVNLPGLVAEKEACGEGFAVSDSRDFSISVRAPVVVSRGRVCTGGQN